MAITTYAELQTFLATQLDTDPGGSIIVDCITLGEARINGDLSQIPPAWSTSTPSGSVGSRALTLPTGFLEPRSLFLTTNSEHVLLRPFVAGTLELDTSNGMPSAWCIQGETINLDVPCDQAHTFLFHYRAKWGIAASSTNWLLTNAPDVYVAAAMIELSEFREGVDADRWLSKYIVAKERVEKMAARSLVAALTVDPALMPSTPYFNYTTGF
jgi:hypothetical protein